MTDSRPRFVRQEAWRLVRVKARWRRPRGKTSKMRLGMRGWPRIVKVGYKKKRTERGLHPSGRREVLVKRVSDLDKIDPKTQIVKISHSVGERKRVAILEKAQTLELTIANPGPKKPEAAAPEEQELVVKEPEGAKAEQEETKEETEEETGGKAE